MITVMIDENLERFRSEVYYSLDFIFSTLGYSYRLINRLSEVGEREILLLYAVRQPSMDDIRYIAQNRVVFFVPADASLLDNSHRDFSKLKQQIRDVTIFHKTPVLSAQDLEAPLERIHNETSYFGSFGFDFLGNIFYHLSGSEELTDTRRDELGRRPDEYDLFLKYAHQPYVNELLYLFDSYLRQGVETTARFLIRKDYWPSGQAKAVCFTHGVDALHKWNMAEFVSSIIKDFGLVLSSPAGWVRSCWSKVRFLFTNDEPYWNFDLIQQICRNHYPVTATWFFSSSHGKKLDVDYKLNNNEVSTIIRQLLSDKQEIALLASFLAAETEGTLTLEAEKLAEHTSQKVGCRLNYQRLLPGKTYENLAKSEPVYDNSFGYVDTNGYKAGIALPFKPWDNQRKRALPFIEIPLVFSDDRLFTAPSHPVSRAEAQYQVDELTGDLEKAGGMMLYNLSLSGFADLPYLKELLDHILVQEKAERFWRPTVGQLARWWQARSEVKINLEDDGLRLQANQAVPELTLIMHGNWQLVAPEGVKCTQQGSRYTVHSIPAKASLLFGVNKPE